MDIDSMVWYLVIMGFISYFLLLDRLAHYQGYNMGNPMLLLSCVCLAFFMACRGISVGADTQQYYYGFEQIQAMELNNVLTEPVYGFGGGTN